MPTTYTVTFPTDSQYISLPIVAPSIILVAGPNGVGKSALLATIYRSLPEGVATYLPGHRQINFNNGWETIGQDATQLFTNMFKNSDIFNRYKSAWAEDQFKSIVRKLLHLESAYNREFRKGFSIGTYSNPEQGSIRLSPVDTLNLIFEGSRLPVRFELTDEGLSARREDAVYSIDAMSDGERAALFIVSAVVTQKGDTVLLIDEPEKHLHPSITGLLLEACIRARPEISIVVSSHDVLLIERLSPTIVIHIRDSKVTQIKPEVRRYDAAILPDIRNIPDDLRVALLGSRSAVLFVEGQIGSNDLALYSHIYEQIKILPRGGHGKVQESVITLRALVDQHWLSASGIIDGDGREENERQTLSSKGIFTLPCPSIENVFFYEEMIQCFVEADSSYAGGLSLADRMSMLENRISTIAIQEKPEIVSLRTSWLLERKLSESKRSPQQMKILEQSPIEIDVENLRNSVQFQVESNISSGKWQKILQDLPIKKTKLPGEAAKILGASSFKEYCSVILRQFDLRSASGITALSALRQKFPHISQP